jgi:hypothetical protein
MFELVVVHDQMVFFFCPKFIQTQPKLRHLFMVSCSFYFSLVYIAFPLAFPLFSFNSLGRSGLVSCILLCPLLLGRGLTALTCYSGPGLLLGIAHWSSLAPPGVLVPWCSGPYWPTLTFLFFTQAYLFFKLACGGTMGWLDGWRLLEEWWLVWGRIDGFRS